MKFIYFLLISTIFISKVSASNLVLIANGIENIDKKTISKVYKGKIVQINDLDVIPINSSNNILKNNFLKKYLKMDDEKFLAYWTVRQYIGKGVAPKEIDSSKEILDFILNNKGAIGYINKNDIKSNPEIKKFIVSIN